MNTSASPSSPTISDSTIPSNAIAAAAERRNTQRQSPTQLIAGHEKRLAFRRLLDPGIMRPNSYSTAMEAIKTLLTIADNLLREPDNPKFQRFKPTNPTIKARLIDPRGTLEYAVALGFQPEVEHFQPYYVFSPKKMHELHMGADILREYLEVETRKREREERSKRDAKAASDAAANKVKLAFLDDRIDKSLRDEREKELRAARAHATQGSSDHATESLPSPSSPHMTGRGSIINIVGTPTDPATVEDENM